MYLEQLLAAYRSGPSNFLFIVSGPSGAGKTVLCKEAAGTFENLLHSISYTTRPQRDQEVNGRDYFFLSNDEFEAKIKQGDFLEWAKVHGNYYGTCKHWITEQLAGGKDIILDIDIQGADQIRKQPIPSCSIFVTPPSMEILRQRLVNRASDKAADIAQRLKNAEEEIKNARDYQYLIINDKLSKATEQLTSIIKAWHCLLNPLPKTGLD